MSLIDISQLDLIFGSKPELALAAIDRGKERLEIADTTKQLVALSGINLSINAGEIFVLMGLSGSGKSSLLRAINGLLPISRGQISITIKDGANDRRIIINEADKDTMRILRMHHVAMVFQNFALLPWKNVSSNVAFGLEIALTKRHLIEQKVKECLSLVGLSNWANHYPHQLSGGMQQRVGLARALATDARILLMDEPFSALDPVIRGHLQQELVHLQKVLNKTILFVTHDLDEALRIGSRIAIMQEGKIIQVGRAEDIVSNPKTSYVKSFVSHIDQTRLLRAKSIMTAIGDLKINATDSSILLDRYGIYRCLLDESGRPRRSLCDDIEGRIIPWTLFQSGTFSQHDLVLGNEYLMFKEVIDAVGRTKKPMVIQDKSGKMIGAVTNESILMALSTK